MVPTANEPAGKSRKRKAKIPVRSKKRADRNVRPTDSPARLDVLGIGCVAVDDLLYVAAYPPADGKTRVQRRERQCGGLTATALVAASRLGVRTAYAGVLGADELSAFAVSRLEAEGVSTEHLVRDPAARPVHSVIVVAAREQSRNIFFHPSGVAWAHPDLPPAGVIRSARVLFVDNEALPNVLRAARIAAEAGIPVVADLENETAPGFPELFGLVDHVILSSDFAERLAGRSGPDAAANELQRRTGRTVVVTCGKDGLWYMADGLAESRHVPAFRVQTADTTGCGDVFHGAYAAALARGLDLPQRVRFASAAAALKATRPGGQLGIPSRAQVEDFLKDNP
jgi:ribokinase